MSITSPLPGIASWMPVLLLMVVLSAIVSSDGVCADEALPNDLSQFSVRQLQDSLRETDGRLTQLARYSLQSGVGAIGYRSQSHDAPNNIEWVEVVFPDVTVVDEVILVPAILRDINLGFTSDAFPIKFRVLADADDNSADQIEIASFSQSDRLLPRIAPLIVPCDGVKARRIRIEANLLGQRKFDGLNLLQLSEVLIFSDKKNVALHQKVLTSSNAPTGSPAWDDRFLVDGVVPYSMHSARGTGSLAYVHNVAKGTQPTLTVDLGIAQPVSQIRLHLVDQSDTVPTTFSGDFAVPRLLQLTGANRADFADAKILLQIKHENDFDVGPIVERHFAPKNCRHLRLTAIDPYELPSTEVDGQRFGFAEIEILAKGKNIALGKVFDSEQGLTNRRRLEALTDGSNFYGRILPLHDWLFQLAERHELEINRPLVAAELNGRYLRQRNIMRALLALVALLAIGAISVVFIGLSQRRKAIVETRDQIAADLHDELGGNVSAMGLLSDLVQNSAASPEKLAPLMQRMRELSERTGIAARHCTNMLESVDLCDDLKQDMLRTSKRLTADLKHELSFSGEQHLGQLSSRMRFDLFLFYKECLTNILRHSGATEVVTHLTADTERISLKISDNGNGMDGVSEFPVPPSLKRRARFLRGQVTAEPYGPKGVTIKISLQLKKQSLSTRFGFLPRKRT